MSRFFCRSSAATNPDSDCSAARWLLISSIFLSQKVNWFLFPQIEYRNLEKLTIRNTLGACTGRLEIDNTIVSASRCKSLAFIVRKSIVHATENGFWIPALCDRSQYTMFFEAYTLIVIESRINRTASMSASYAGSNTLTSYAGNNTLMIISHTFWIDSGSALEKIGIPVRFLYTL